MRFSPASWHLLLMLLPSLASTVVVPDDDTLATRLKVEDTAKGVAGPKLDTLATYSTSKTEKGTKDAPVDGSDGKPHSGPLVDSLKETGNSVTGSTKLSTGKDLGGITSGSKKQTVAEGTTGTEGGVTERKKELSRLEEIVGEDEMPAKVPDPPKEAPPIPVAEHAALGLDTTSVTGASTDEAESDVVPPAKPKGAQGIEKPTNLPAAPFDGPGSADDDLSDDNDDDDDDDDDDEDGEHDVLPLDSFVGAFLSILVTEIGDKTFLIAALMAMRHPRFQVFTAAASALILMTILSAVTGHAVGSLLSKGVTAMIAGLLFLLFGGKSMQEGLAMSPDQGVSEEMEEVRAELEEKEESMAQQSYGRRGSTISPYALEAGRAGSRKSRSNSRLPMPPRSPSESPSGSGSPRRPTINSAIAGFKNLLSLLLSPAWVETFAMTFVGELGDRSQIATVAMAAGQEYVWIMIGAMAGHLCCTAGAVLGGSALAGRVSMRKVTLMGAWVFLAFGIYTLYEALQYFHDS